VSRYSKELAKWRPILLVVAILAFLFAGWSWTSVRGLSDVRRETQSGPWIQLRTSADYTVTLSRSALYPSGAVIKPGQAATIPMRLFSSANITLASELTYSGGNIAAGNYWVDLRVRAGELWSKDYTAVTKREIDPELPVIETSFALPLTTILNDIARIEREIGMFSPTGKYEVDVRLHAQVTQDGGTELVHELSPVYTFALATSGLVLETPKQLVTLDRRSEDQQIEVPNTRQFMGQDRLVADVKHTTSIMLVVALLLLVGAVGLSISVGRSLPTDPGRRYRDRVIKVTGLGAARLDLSVRVSGLKELARIADESQVPLMELDQGAKVTVPAFDTEPTPDLMGRRYFLITGSTIYYVV